MLDTVALSLNKNNPKTNCMYIYVNMYTHILKKAQIKTTVIQRLKRSHIPLRGTHKSKAEN